LRQQDKCSDRTGVLVPSLVRFEFQADQTPDSPDSVAKRLLLCPADFRLESLDASAVQSDITHATRAFANLNRTSTFAASHVFIVARLRDRRRSPDILTRGTQMSATKTCLFCGRVLPPKRIKNGKSDEHIIPQWLMDHLGLCTMPVTGMRWDVPSRQVLEHKQHGVRRFVSGGVCAGCNGGWMSQLETEAKPILIRLIADPHELLEDEDGS
jgi:hypothetical protein